MPARQDRRPRDAAIRTAAGLTMITTMIALAACGPASTGARPEPTSQSPTPSQSGNSPLPQQTPTPAETPTPSPQRSSQTPRSSASSGSPSPAPAARRPVIVLDPGHSGRSIRSRTQNGLLDFDYPNQPEMTEMFAISSCLATELRGDGYRVISTKHSAEVSVSLTERAAIANRARADLAVSLHDDHSQDASFQATYSQRGIAHDGRYHPMYRGRGERRTVFDHSQVARRSEKFAQIIARERSTAQQRPVTVRENVYTGRAPLEPGNLALVQLLADVPWVYNEAGARSGGSTSRRLSLAAETGYALGVLNGIETAVPVGGEASPRSSATPAADRLRSCLRKRR